jgi:uncharacterized RDD family membrane protein YckC
MPWFYLHDGESRGPFNGGEFQSLVAAGTIEATTLVRSEERPDWQPFGTLTLGAPVPCTICGASFSPDAVVDIAGTGVCAQCKPIQLQRLREGAIPETAPTWRFAGVWIRGLAALVDAMVLFSVSLAVSLLSGLTLAEALGFDGSEPEGPLWSMEDSIWIASDFLISTCYETFFVATFAGTPGKRLCRLRIIRADGGRLTLRHALARSLAEWASILPCGGGYLVAAFDKEKRALHDLICNTRVVWAPKT